MWSRRVLLLSVLIVSSWPLTLAAQEGDPVARREAADRFDCGLSLFNQGDNAGALAEFKRSYALAREPAILFNMALVYVALKRPVDALEALERLLLSPGNLSEERKARAEAARADLVGQVAEIDVRTNVPALVEVDGAEVGRTPLERPIRVARGHRSVGVAAPGHLPSRQAIDIAGGERQVLTYDLVPLKAARAHLKIATSVPAVAITVDGTEVGRTPLSTNVSVAPGRHRVSFRRTGYRDQQREVTVAEADVVDLMVEMVEDGPALAAVGGYLIVQASESPVNIVVDGRPRGIYAAPLLLPPGSHQVQVTRAGFQPIQATSVITPGKDSTISVRLIPNAETLNSRAAATRTQKIWGWASIATGAALVAGAGAYLLVNRRDKVSAREQQETTLRNAELGSQRECDPSWDSYRPVECTAKRYAADLRVARTKERDKYGYLTAGIGLVTTAVGVVLLLTADEVVPSEAKVGSVPRGPGRWSLAPTATLASGGGSVGFLLGF